MLSNWHLFRNLLCVLLLFTCFFSKAQITRTIIDSLKQAAQGTTDQNPPIRLWFAISDGFMELDAYDSAQLWLNRISEVLPLQTASIDNYFLSTRQAEVFYYNGLQRLGLQESERSLAIAQALNDSLLLADSYNFIGLFYINLDSVRKAIPYFKKGIQYVRQPPYPAAYLSLSKPHHLYGNLAEAYEKLHQYDSALLLNHISHRLATAINWHRGIAVARFNLGSCYFKKRQWDSAYHYFDACVQQANASSDFDVELIGYGGLAKTADAQQHQETAMQWLEKGRILMQEKQFVNLLFRSNFLDDAAHLYQKYGASSLLVATLKNKADVLQKQFQSNNRQINLILNAGLQNETRLLNLQVRQSRQQTEIIRTRLILVILVFSLFIFAFIFYRYKTSQQLRLIRLQNKISQDLHDDVGSSVSSLQVYSTVAEDLVESEPSKAKEMLRKITKESSAVMENIGDIVWSMKPATDQSLNERVKNFVADVLGAANIRYEIHVDAGIEDDVKNIEARRNIVFIIKEAVNNVVKYSHAGKVWISIQCSKQKVEIEVRDDGIGFDVLNSRKGNGLTHMKLRSLEMGGTCDITSQPGKGTSITVSLPLAKISDLS